MRIYVIYHSVVHITHQNILFLFVKKDKKFYVVCVCVCARACVRACVVWAF